MFLAHFLCIKKTGVPPFYGCCRGSEVGVPSSWVCMYTCMLIPKVCLPLPRPLWMMALLKCCEEKHWFATPLIHCWSEGNLHSRQTRGPIWALVSLPARYFIIITRHALRFQPLCPCLACNLNADLAEEKRKAERVRHKLRCCAWLRYGEMEKTFSVINPPAGFIADGGWSHAVDFHPSVVLSTQVQISPSLSPSFSVSIPWQACCSAVGDSACYWGHADESRSIGTPKPQHPSGELCVCVCVYLGIVRTGICPCMSVGAWALRFGTKGGHMRMLLSPVPLCPWGC